MYETHERLFIRQQKEWTEILVDWETSNRYAVMDEHKQPLGMIAERRGKWGTILKRFFLRSHRPFEIDVFDQVGESLLHLSRGFFFFFSDLEVRSKTAVLGRVERRFAFLTKKYDLKDMSGQVFARIRSPFWRIWTFEVEAERHPLRAIISKKWGGALRELFADADTFLVDYGGGSPTGSPWTKDQRAVILAAAISIDFDFFENNQGRGGLVDLLPVD